jgi:tRNA-Thr(GGU) m(6)t(6)A37 methyltransferase TsaA
MNSEIKFEAVGYVHCGQQYRSEAPRQGIFADNEGIIRFEKRHNFEQALVDLKGFSHIWVIFCFHLNDNWKPLVQPPVVGQKKKVSVFATRSPHRPNSIGMSCVELVKIDGRDVHIRNFDMLNNSPVLDIKPYIPRVDSFPDAQIGWLEKAKLNSYQISFSEEAEKQMLWLNKRNELDLKSFCEVQLVHDPVNASRKRIHSKNNNEYIIFCRTWQIHFTLDEENRQININFLKSNYSSEELLIASADPYNDKDIHREFIRHIPKEL